MDIHNDFKLLEFNSQTLMLRNNVMANVYRLKEISELRAVWPNEARDFTPWLAESDNIALLSEAVGINILIDEIESSVGRYNVDIYASEADTDRKIIIENQLENSNHDHLGKLITYASGKSADVIIWVVKHARDENKKAIQWLNTHTDGNIAFFLCEIKLFQVNSSFAVRFNVIEKPDILTLNNTLSGKNRFLEILDFLKLYAKRPYQNPDNVIDQIRKDELMTLKESAREASNMMFNICSQIASRFNLTLSSATRKWLDGSNSYIRNYFWGQLKNSESNSPISISIFATPDQYRLSLELNTKHATSTDYNIYKRYLELPIDTNRLKFYSKQTTSDENASTLNLTPDEVRERINKSDNPEDRIQLSYVVSRKNEATNTDKTEEMFYQELYRGIQLLKPYYEHVLNAYHSENR